MPEMMWRNEKLQDGQRGKKQEITFTANVTYESCGSVSETFGISTDEAKDEINWMLKTAMKNTSRISDVVMYIANMGRWDVILYLATLSIIDTLDKHEMEKIPKELAALLKTVDDHDCEHCPVKDVCPDSDLKKKDPGDGTVQ